LEAKKLTLTDARDLRNLDLLMSKSVRFLAPLALN